MPGRVLPFLLCCSIVFSAHARGEVKDTITVDGVPLQLNLDVREGVAPSEEGTTGRGGRMSGWSPVPHVAIAPGMGMWAQDVAGVPVSSFAERPVTRRWGGEVGLTWSTDRLNFRVVASTSVDHIRTADLTSIQDSAVAIMADGAGGIEQHIVQTYELGQELDTVALATDDRWVQSAGMAFRMGSQDRKGSGLRLWAGAGIRWSKLDRKSGELERLPATGMPERSAVQGDQRLDWVPKSTLGWEVTVTLERQWQGPWSSTFGATWCSGPRGRTGLHLGIARHFLR
ncbi:MAG: hypothetical protein CMC97_05425 [Flavobacteriales bacterium]|nr:hypothetical protein [Flavobacteriales bacterium]